MQARVWLVFATGTLVGIAMRAISTYVFPSDCALVNKTLCAVNGQCVNCLQDAQCASGLCVAGECTQCVEDRQCDDKKDCTLDICRSNQCEHFVTCTDGVCDEDTGQCVTDSNQPPAGNDNQMRDILIGGGVAGAGMQHCKSADELTLAFASHHRLDERLLSGQSQQAARRAEG